MRSPSRPATRPRRGRPASYPTLRYDGEALVQPARREVVRVLDRRVEHEVDELVRDDVLDPRVVDLARRDEREQRPDVGVRLAADVLARARSERVVERVAVGVDEEVDRFVLGRRRAARRSVRPLPRRCAGRARRTPASPSYQWTRTTSPSSVCQSKRSSAYDGARLRTQRPVAAVGRDPPAHADGVFGRMWPSRLLSVCRSVAAPASGGGATSVTSGAGLSAVVSSTSTRSGAAVERDRLASRRSASPNEPSIVGRPNSGAAARTGRRDRPRGAERQRRPQRLRDSAIATGRSLAGPRQPREAQEPRPFWPAPRSPSRDRAQPVP